MGGIYALERIARESEKDHWSIMEVLTAYVRQHSPRRPEGGQGGEAEAAVEKKTVEDSTGETDTTEVATPDPDIKAIMTVIRRRTRSFGHGEPERIHLRETDLTRAELSEANLSGAELLGTELLGANLLGANLTDATLHESLLFEVNLSGADLTRADLTEANLQGADLSGARNVTQAQLEESAGNEATRLPSDREPPAHWNVKTNEQIEGD